MLILVNPSKGPMIENDLSFIYLFICLMHNETEAPISLVN